MIFFSSTVRGADDIENTASSIVACRTVFTVLLPGNMLIESVTIHLTKYRATTWHASVLCNRHSSISTVDAILKNVAHIKNE
jgi:hypothetical protein